MIFFLTNSKQRNEFQGNDDEVGVKKKFHSNLINMCNLF